MDAPIEYTPAPEDAFPPRPPSYLEQNYAVHVFRDVKGAPGNDILAAAHPNGIAFLALAPSHPALRQVGLGDGSADISDDATLPARLAFELPEPPADRSGGGGRGRGGRGKGKKNRAADVYLGHGQTLARLICGREEGGDAGKEEHQREWVLACPLRGRLVEANAALEGLQGVELLNALRDGYLAVVEVKTGEVERAAAAAVVAAAAEGVADG